MFSESQHISQQHISLHEAASMRSAAAFGGGTFPLCLRKKDCTEQLGVDIACFADGYCLKVMNIKSGGLFAAWNEQCDAGKSINPGDHIVSVNGYIEVADMLSKCRTGRVLKMLIRPYEPHLNPVRPSLADSVLKHSNNMVTAHHS